MKFKPVVLRHEQMEAVDSVLNGFLRENKAVWKRLSGDRGEWTPLTGPANEFFSKIDFWVKQYGGE